MATTRRRGRRATAGLLGLALGAAAMVAPPGAPAGAAPTDSDTLVFVPSPSEDPVTAFVRNGEVTTASYVGVRDAILAGDFSAAPGTDVFAYAAGADEPDGIIHVTPTGVGVTTSFQPETVRGRYEPVVGDFDGNDIDDILWYGPYSTIDSIWLFQPDGSHEIVSISVTGRYQPIVLDADGDGDDDVVWYADRGSLDSMWVFGEGATYTTRRLTVSSDHYFPMVGRFGGVPDGGEQEQILWYNPIGPDAVWTFTEFGKTSRPLPPVDQALWIDGDFLGTGRDSVLWYRPGADPETMTTFGADGVATLGPAPQVKGIYDAEVGDFDGDGDDGIAWTFDGKALIWSFDDTSPTGYTQTWVDTGHAQTSSIVVPAGPLPD